METKVKDLMNKLRCVQTIVRKPAFIQLFESSNGHQQRTVESLCMSGQTEAVRSWFDCHPNRDIQIMTQIELRKLCSDAGIPDYSNLKVAEMREAILAEKTRVRDSFISARMANSKDARIACAPFLISRINLVIGEAFGFRVRPLKSMEQNINKCYEFLMALVEASNKYTGVLHSRDKSYWDACSELDDETVALADLKRKVKHAVRVAIIPKGIKREQV